MCYDECRIIRQVMVEASAAKLRAALHLLRIALTGLGQLCCAETTVIPACGAFNTMTGRVGKNGKQVKGKMGRRGLVRLVFNSACGRAAIHGVTAVFQACFGLLQGSGIQRLTKMLHAC